MVPRVLLVELHVGLHAGRTTFIVDTETRAPCRPSDYGIAIVGIGNVAGGARTLMRTAGRRDGVVRDPIKPPR